MSTETLLLIFVGVTALAFTVQCVSIWSTSRSMRTLIQRLEQRSEEIEGKFRTLQDRLLTLSEDLEPLQSSAKDLGANLETISARVRERSEDVDDFVQEILKVGRQQASKIDFLVSDTVQKFEQTTEVIQKDMLRPAVEISSFVKGVRAGLNVLLSGETPRPDRQQQEEELFI